MSLVVQTNIAMVNAQTNYKVVTGKKAKSAEALGSGYRINQAADDAAGLSISEKMRWQIRGLERGERNGQDGISWVQTGDQALAEVHDMLHRMRELTVQALNDTNNQSDRAALQAEYDALQSEIDKVSKTTLFNTLNIFEEHEPTFYELEGNVKWPQSGLHTINVPDNKLIVEFKRAKDAAPETIEIEVPSGSYTTQELTDEIDDALMAMGEEDIVMEYSDDGTFNLCVEGGSEIISTTGGLNYLLYETYKGGSVGSLIGTTVFEKESDRLEIGSQNNTLKFNIEDFNGNSTEKSIVIPNGEYTRQELLDIFNNELQGTGVSAVAYGTGIKLTSNDKIITGFKGNMFKIDSVGEVYSSVFYDNVKYGDINLTAAKFTGGAVVTTSSKDLEHQKYNITSSNDTLTFSANGSDVPVSITIPEGEYTVDDMATKLNELFTANNLELKASAYTSGSYKGLTITSNILGAQSKVGLDSGSSAYKTLFVDRVYNSYTNVDDYAKENVADRVAGFMGSKAVDANVPMQITSANNSFKLKVTDSQGNTIESTIVLGSVTYNTADDIKNEIEKRINDITGIKNSVKVSLDNGRIKFTGADGVKNVEALEITGNNGYNDLFIKETVKSTVQEVYDRGTVGSPAQVTLNTPLTNGTIIDDSNNKLTIKVDGVEHTVELPKGEIGNGITQDDIINAIEDKIKRQETTYNNTFTTVRDTGERKENYFFPSDSGDVNSTTMSYSDVGETDKVEGAAGSYKNNEPAKVTINNPVASSVKIDSTNNYFLVKINGVSKSITLDSKTYTPSQLADELQKKIDDAYGKNMGGAKVSLDSSGRLVIEARLNYADGGEAMGKNTSIEFSTGCSFVKELHTTRTPATITTGAMLDEINITDDTNTFKFNFTEAGSSQQSITLTLTNGKYSRDSFIAEINRQLKNQGIGVKAERSGSAIKFITDKTGSGNYLSYSATDGGTSVEAIFGPMVKETPASVTVGRDTLTSINIDDTSNEFSIRVNGTLETVTLTNSNGTPYDITGLVSELNNQFAAKGLDVVADHSGNKLTFTTKSTGTGASIEVDYTNGGSAMKAIYGTSTNVKTGVEASFDTNGNLVLQTTENGSGHTISVTSGDGKGSLFQNSTQTIEKTAPTKNDGYTSAVKSYVDGRDLNEPITIDEWNDDLKFSYYHNGTTHTIDIKVENKEYATYGDLERELQNKVDTALGGSAGALDVTVAANGVRIEATNPGSKYYLVNNFQGDFYDKVINKAEEKISTTYPSNADGNKPTDTAYTIGRKDVKNKITEIKDGVNDTLTIDFTQPSGVETFTIDLASGSYNGEALKNEIQKKLDEQLIAKGYDAGMIEVGIGGIHTGVIGSNDDNALNFSLSKEAKILKNGTYILDGVRGNAAFSVFYQTDGELVPAYIKGARDITEGVTIKPGEEEFSFKVDGTQYDINVPEGDYTSQELLDKINAQLTASNAPVIAELDEGALRLSYVKLGEHTIGDVKGSAMEEIFFVQNSDDRDESGVLIQLSSMQGDTVTIDKPIINTVALKINSTVITKPKYANKALERLDYALNEVSEARVMFGVMQNRLEHIIKSNANTAENVQRSESLLRDANMAEEMVEYSKNNILQQAGQSMMSHIKMDSEGVLRLLQS